MRPEVLAFFLSVFSAVWSQQTKPMVDITYVLDGVTALATKSSMTQQDVFHGGWQFEKRNKKIHISYHGAHPAVM